LLLPMMTTLWHLWWSVPSLMMMMMVVVMQHLHHVLLLRRLPLPLLQPASKPARPLAG